jgi:hypothetical protein
LSLLLILIVAVAAAVVFWPRPEFIVDFHEGRAEIRRGKVPRGFAEDCRRLGAECGIRSGRVSGTRGARGIELRFSADIDPADQQRFRNVWSLHG